jgi:hypothetical protein
MHSAAYKKPQITQAFLIAGLNKFDDRTVKVQNPCSQIPLFIPGNLAFYYLTYHCICSLTNVKELWDIGRAILTSFTVCPISSPMSQGFTSILCSLIQKLCLMLTRKLSRNENSGSQFRQALTHNTQVAVKSIPIPGY